jgi:MFS family permease
VLIVSLLVCFFAVIMQATAHDFFTAELSRLLMGASSAPSVVCGMYLASHWFSKKRFVMLASLLETTGLFGGAVSQSLLSIVVTYFGWRHAIVACAILAAILLLLTYLFVKDSPLQTNEISTDKTPLREVGKSFMCIVKSKQVWFSCLYGGFMFSVITGFAGLWSIPFIQLIYKDSTIAAANASALIFLGVSIGTFSIGSLACYYSNMKRLMMLASFINLFLMVLIVYCPMPFDLLKIIFFLLGFVSGAYVLAFACVKTRCNSKNNAAAMGFTNMLCILLGAPLMQPLIGGVLQFISSIKGQVTLIDYQYSLTLFIVYLMLAFIISLLSKEHCQS